MIISHLSQKLAPPIFDDDEKTRVAGLQNTIFLGAIALAVITGLAILIVDPEPIPRLLATAIWIPLGFSGLFLMRRGRVNAGSRVFSYGAWLLFTMLAWVSGGVMSPGLVSYTIAILIASLLCGSRGATVFSLMSVAASAAILYAQLNDLLPRPYINTTATWMWISLTLNFIAAAVLLHMATRSITGSLEASRQHRSILLASNRNLQDIQVSLGNRTLELTTAVELLENELTERKQLLDALKQSEDKLRNLNEALEERVQIRTRELANTNEALQQEIIERERAETALRNTFTLVEQAKLEWESTADTLPQFVCLLDQEGRIIRANRTVEHWGLAKVTAIRNRQIHELFHPDCNDIHCYLSNFWRQASEELEHGRPATCEAEDVRLGRYLQFQVRPILTQTSSGHLPPSSHRIVVVQDLTDRKQAETALKESEARLALAISGTNGALWDEELDPDTTFDELTSTVYLSPEEKKLLGYEDDELPHSMAAWDKHVLAEDMPRREESQRDHFEGRTAILDHEYRVRRKDGTIRWIHGRSRIIRDEHGRPIRWIGIDWDVTERKQVEEELQKFNQQLETLVKERTVELAQTNARLQQSEENFRALANNAYDGLLIISGDETVVYANRRMCEITGYSQTELLTSSISDLFHPDQYETVSARYWLRVADRPAINQYETSLMHRTGHEVPIELTASKTNWYGQAASLAVIRDITERRQAEADLRQAEQRYRRLFEDAPAMYVITQSQAGTPVVIDCNGQFLNILHYNDRSEVIGRPLADFYSPESQAELVTGGYQRALDGIFTAEERQLVTREGHIVETLLRAGPEIDAAGQVYGTRAMFVDISDRRQAEQALRESEALLRHVINSISDHIYVTEITAEGQHINRYLSPHVERLTGRTRQRLLDDWNVWSSAVIHPADRAAAATQLANLEQGRSSEVEYRLVRTDGKVIWVRDSARVEQQESSTIIYGLVSDITGRKEAEQTILHYTKRLEILRQIDRGILEAQSLAAIARAAVSRIRQLIPCQQVSLAFLDFAAEEAIITLTDHETKGLVEQESRVSFKSSFNRPGVLDQLRQGQVVIIDRQSLAQRIDPVSVQTRGIGSVMVVPLISEEGMIGSLNFVAGDPATFTAEHQDIGHQLVEQLAVAIQQARLREQIQHYTDELEQRVADRTRELSTLYEVTAVASESMEFQDILERSLEQVLIAMQGQVGTIFLRAEAKARPQLIAQRGIMGEALPEFENLLLDGGLIYQVLDEGSPLMIADLTADIRIPDEVAPAGLHSYVGVPIRTGGQLVGVVSVFGASRQQFNVEDAALLASIGDQLGVTVENDRLRQQAKQAAVMEERERLARELHDSVTQSLYSLTLFTEGSLELAKNGEMELVEHNLARIGETAQQALKEMRLLVYELRPLDLEKEGLVGALHQRLATVEKRAGVNARLVVEELIELSPAVESELYRVTQEALNNALKHAEATSITVYLRAANEYVELEIMDNGKGFYPDQADREGGLGLLSMQERIEKLGGSLDILSTPAKGTIVHVRVKNEQQSNQLHNNFLNKREEM